MCQSASARVKDQKGVELEVYVFGPAEKALANAATTGFRDTLAGLAKNGVPVHVCLDIAESLGKAEEFTKLGFKLEYAREAFVRYALEGATVISF